MSEKPANTETREERMARALRENLRRRKAQAKEKKKLEQKKDSSQ